MMSEKCLEYACAFHFTLDRFCGRSFKFDPFHFHGNVGKTKQKAHEIDVSLHTLIFTGENN